MEIPFMQSHESANTFSDALIVNSHIVDGSANTAASLEVLRDAGWTMTTSTSSPWIELTTLGDPPPVYIPDRNTPGHPEFRIPSGRAKCPACGQWGEREHACDYCGHPVD